MGVTDRELAAYLDSVSRLYPFGVPFDIEEAQPSVSVAASGVLSAGKKSRYSSKIVFIAGRALDVQDRVLFEAIVSKGLGLSMLDVELVVLAPGSGLQAELEKASSALAIVLGADISSMGNQDWHFRGETQVVCAPRLSEIASDSLAKRSMWKILKQAKAKLLE